MHCVADSSIALHKPAPGAAPALLGSQPEERPAAPLLLRLCALTLAVALGPACRVYEVHPSLGQPSARDDEQHAGGWGLAQRSRRQEEVVEIGSRLSGRQRPG